VGKNKKAKTKLITSVQSAVLTLASLEANCWEFDGLVGKNEEAKS
jgi:hypothetical protein